MARITVEDCIDKVENRFELVAVAAQRAKEIASGGELTVDRDNDKDTVVALREIANTNVSVDKLRENLMQNYQKPFDTDDLDIIGGNLEDASDDAKNKEVLELLEDETEATLPNDSEDALSFSEDNIEVDD